MTTSRLLDLVECWEGGVGRGEGRKCRRGDAATYAETKGINCKPDSLGMFNFRPGNGDAVEGIAENKHSILSKMRLFN